MGTKREKPSTKARREGYCQLMKLEQLLGKLLFYKYIDKDDEHWFNHEFDRNGWKDFMIRHTPALKRGGPSERQPNKSKRRRQKQADRNSTVRSGLR